MTYPLAQSGSLSLPTGVYTIQATRTNVNQSIPLYSVAGSGDAHARYVQGIEVEEYIASGVVKKSDASIFGLAQASTMTLPAELDVKAQSWRIRRRWLTLDVTGSGDATKDYVYSLPFTSMSVGGVSKTGYFADHATQSLTLTTYMSQFGTVEGDLKLSSKVDLVRHFPGGTTLVQFAGEFSGAPTFTPLTVTGTNDDFEWLMDADAPVEGELVLDGGGATNLQPRVMVYDVTVELVPRDGGAMRVTARMRKTL